MEKKYHDLLFSRLCEYLESQGGTVSIFSLIPILNEMYPPGRCSGYSFEINDVISVAEEKGLVSFNKSIQLVSLNEHWKLILKSTEVDFKSDSRFDPTVQQGQ